LINTLITIKILLGNFNAKVGRGDIFKPIIGNESLQEICNDNGVRVVNFATSKNLTVKSTMFPHRNIYKHTWTSPDGKTHNQTGHILVDRRRHSNVLDVRAFRAADCDTDHYLLVAKVRERQAVDKQRSQKKTPWSESASELYRPKQRSHRFHMEKSSLIKLNEVEGK
jgi:hypothetical protein